MSVASGPPSGVYNSQASLGKANKGVRGRYCPAAWVFLGVVEG